MRKISFYFTNMIQNKKRYVNRSNDLHLRWSCKLNKDGNKCQKQPDAGAP